MSFEFLGLSDPLLKAVKDAGYNTPTPIQKQAIPSVLMGKDVLGIAQTGTGKTAGFTLPMIDILAEGKTKARIPRSLILEPTRELAVQIEESFLKYGKNHNLSCGLFIGGTSMEKQIAILNKGVDVLIATPGRLLDHFERGNVMLTGIEILVIDEADRMLDMGFIPDVERIRKLITKKPQTLFFSATMPPPIKKLTNAFLDDPKMITVSAPTMAAETVEQTSIATSPQGKGSVLKKVLSTKEATSALVFCNTKKSVSAVYKALKGDGFNARELHGDMDQSIRLEVLNGFKDGSISFLIASDVAARGLDIKDVSHVINYDVPQNVEDYIHRIGRTGRAGKRGHAIVFVTRRDQEQFDKIKRLVKMEIKEHVFGGAKPIEPKNTEQKKAEPQKAEPKNTEQKKVEPKKAEPKKQEQAKPQQKRQQNNQRSNRRPGGHKIMEMEDAKVGMGAHVPAFMRQPLPGQKS